VDADPLPLQRLIGRVKRCKIAVSDDFPLDDSRCNDDHPGVGEVKQAIRQTRPFGSPAEEAFVTLLHTSDALQRNVALLLKDAGLTLAQYNVLRILRGAGSQGLPCGEIASRMLTRDPDMTRLLDRLAAQTLVARTRQVDDRRVVNTRITSAGLARICPLDASMMDLHRRQLGHLGDKRLLQLTALLDAARSGAAVDDGLLRDPSEDAAPRRTGSAPRGAAAVPDSGPAARPGASARPRRRASNSRRDTDA
jgi:DNA-binding MarR family transcriptional regulator